MYNIFRYAVVKHKDPRRARIGGYPGFIDPEYDYLEIRYAVGIYQGSGFGYEAADGAKVNSYKELPYTTNESTARSRAWRRWGYSKMIDVNYW